MGAFAVLWNDQIEIRDCHGFRVKDGPGEDVIDNRTRIFNRDTFAGTVPAGIYQINMSVVGSGLARQFLSVFERMQ